MHSPVRKHYGSPEIVGRILAAVPWPDESGSPLTAASLFPYDQLHGRAIQATREHAARLNPSAEAHLLDIGSGVGGPARYFASTYGCRVTGIDVTPEFVAASGELGRLCGLAGRVDFLEADAAKLPFPAETFDHAYCFYVGMNLSDTAAVLSEVFRVLKPGARLVWTEVTALTGEPHFPLPWARTAEESHVGTVEQLTALFEDAGFALLAIEDETGSHVDLARKIGASGQVPTAAEDQANHVVLGADFVERRKNYIRSLSEGLIASTLVVSMKPD
ncbi:MAG: methyltransferase domain-containing protein [Defluviimonas sp.]|uniref:class I SAM-dependent methyltransferase n=1 Tax=Albidovulum sp. TaxID=1872424 RepID=UPI001DBF036F|nr:methyltransferase domain-containing protein [Paracoccaceae bacterium]MCC0065160.1 methyltransferase domain-containing protein [Defluviimonas sp.]